jgi:hypothetical protein
MNKLISKAKLAATNSNSSDEHQKKSGQTFVEYREAKDEQKYRAKIQLGLELLIITYLVS